MTKAMGISFALTLAQAWVVAHSYLFASSYAVRVHDIFSFDKVALICH